MLSGGFLGAACIDTSVNKMSVLGRTACPPHELRTLLSSLIAHTTPNLVVVSSKAHESFLACLRDALQQHESFNGSSNGADGEEEEEEREEGQGTVDAQGTGSAADVLVLPSSAWDPGSSRKRLSAVDFRGLVLGPQGHASLKSLALPALLDMKNVPSVQAAGALLQHVSKALMVGAWSPSCVEMHATRRLPIRAP